MQNRFITRVAALVLAGAFALPVAIGAQQNRTAARAASLPTDGTTLGGFIAGAGPNAQAWYVFKMFAGRSYSIQVVPTEIASTPAGISNFVNFNLFQGDAATGLAYFDNYRMEPAVAFESATLAQSVQGSYRSSYAPTAAVEYGFAKMTPLPGTFTGGGISLPSTCPWW